MACPNSTTGHHAEPGEIQCVFCGLLGSKINGELVWPDDTEGGVPENDLDGS